MSSNSSETTPNQIIQREGAIKFAHLAILSLITTCGGALVAMLSFVAQAKPLEAVAVVKLGCSLTILGSALGAALLAAILAYAYQYTVAYRRDAWDPLAYLSLAAVVISLVLLVIGGLSAIPFIQGAVGLPAS